MKAEGGRWKAEGSYAHYGDLTDCRRAITLFELLLVLVLLVVVSSLAAPLFKGSFSSLRLSRGTDQVLATWSQARTHAIEAGEIFQFRFQPEGSNYRVDPWRGGLDPAAQQREELLVDPDKTKAELEFANWKFEDTLPEGISFSKAESASTDQLGERKLSRLDQDKSAAWSEPILFFPDGSTSEASLLLKNSKGLLRRATLRSLTGTARSSDFLTQEEVERMRSR